MEATDIICNNVALAAEDRHRRHASSGERVGRTTRFEVTIGLRGRRRRQACSTLKCVSERSSTYCGLGLVCLETKRRDPMSTRWRGFGEHRAHPARSADWVERGESNNQHLCKLTSK